ncbi:hypothetical protein ALI144C_07925 [Actinosynnema sp. ALI-1.44]|nr:hypothetical protein ALI144C_07925 [Actinosynnema sp. ALI-1.44]
MVAGAVTYSVTLRRTGSDSATVLSRCAHAPTPIIAFLDDLITLAAAIPQDMRHRTDPDKLYVVDIEGRLLDGPELVRTDCRGMPADVARFLTGLAHLFAERFHTAKPKLTEPCGPEFHCQ